MHEASYRGTNNRFDGGNTCFQEHGMHSPSLIFLVAQGLNSKPPRCGQAASGTKHLLSDSKVAAGLSNAGTGDGG